MLSNDDHPGLFVSMIGLIVVVMVGMALSLMVDRRFSFSKSVSGVESDIRAGETELEQLKIQYQQISRELAEIEPKRRMMSVTKESVSGQLAELNRRQTSLAASSEQLRKTIPALVEDFTRYRAKYRDVTWTAAVGQSLGNLTVRGGREYRQAVITRVTDVGLEIRHENGNARVQAPELDQSLQDRFQWNDEERRARLNRENAESEAITRVPDVVKVAEPPKSTNPVRRVDTLPDAGKADVLRGKVMGWKVRVSQLVSERSQAHSAASYGSQSSVPGSLETWEAKAARLDGQLAKARAELAAAKAALSVVVPNDPLLRADPDAP